ncbi:MAG: ABC transporter permease, partial [Acetobacteraceae bacterium]
MSEARALPLPRARSDRPSWTLGIGAALVGAWFIVAVFAPVIAPFNPDQQVLSATLQGPSALHWLGTDNFGRDILSRIIWGTRIDLLMGGLGMLFPFIIGTFIGAVAGYFGGWIDTGLMRLLDVTMSFPFFVLIIAIVAILGAGLVSFFIAVALVGWVSYARLV